MTLGTTAMAETVPGQLSILGDSGLSSMLCCLPTDAGSLVAMRETAQAKREDQITVIPTPGSVVLAAFGGVLIVRRRRD